MDNLIEGCWIIENSRSVHVSLPNFNHNIIGIVDSNVRLKIMPCSCSTVGGLYSPPRIGKVSVRCFENVGNEWRDLIGSEKCQHTYSTVRWLYLSSCDGLYPFSVYLETSKLCTSVETLQLNLQLYWIMAYSNLVSVRYLFLGYSGVLSKNIERDAVWRSTNEGMGDPDKARPSVPALITAILGSLTQLTPLPTPHFCAVAPLDRRLFSAAPAILSRARLHK